MKYRMRAALAAVAMLMPFATRADSWPSHEIRLIVPFAPGQAADVGARIIAAKLGAALKQAIVVENRPGAGGNIALGLAARAPADGYTMFVGSSATHGINPAIYPKMSADPMADFVPVVYTGWTPIVLSAAPHFPYASAKELIASADAKAQPYQVAVANPGARVMLQQFNELAGSHWQPVAYNASGTAFGDVVSGRVPLIFDSLPGSLPLVRAGRVRALAITSGERSEMLPDVPTLAESGLAGFDLAPWNVYFVPKGTPPEIVKRLNKEVLAILHNPETKAALRKAGYEPGEPMNVDRLAEFVKAEAVKWGDLARKTGLKAQ